MGGMSSRFASTQIRRGTIRAATLCATLLLITTALGGLLALDRTNFDFGPRIDSPGRRFTIRPPANWTANVETGGLIRFDESPQGNSGRTLLIVPVQYGPGREAETAEQLRRRLAYPRFSVFQAVRIQPIIYKSRIGPADGVILEDHYRGLVIGVATVAGESFGISLLTGAEGLDMRDRRMFMAFCQTIRVAD